MSRRALPGWAVVLLGTLLVIPFALHLALHTSRSHDEDQHIAAGVLFAREGLLPYRDFPYFHVPYLVYAYGLLFQFTDHYFLASRVFSALCAALTGGAVFTVAWRLFAARPAGQRLAIGAAALTLFLASPVFYDAAGRSWNQELSVLLALLAFLCLDSALPCDRPGRRHFLSGLLLGLAIGVRVTFAPLVLPFAVMLWFGKGPAPVRERMRLLLMFSVGLALALLPVLWAAVSAPAGFLFGNVEFPKLIFDYRLSRGERRAMTLLHKLRYFFTQPTSFLFFGFLATWVAAWLAAWVRPRIPLRSWPRLFFFVLLTLPFLMIGALAPSPVHHQYFYPLAPFLVIGILTLFAGLPPGTPGLRWMWRAGAALVLCTAAFAVPKYDALPNLLRPPRWAPSELRADSRELRRLVPAGRVLTLAPSLPLEAGLQIYPEFATGPFANRIAPVIAPERRAALRLLSPEDLAARLEADPPAAILVGFEGRWDKPLAHYARTHGYRRTSFLQDKELWLPPAKED